MPACKFNPLNTELNPICHLLALLEAHPVFRIRRIRVKQTKQSQHKAIYQLTPTNHHHFTCNIYTEHYCTCAHSNRHILQNVPSSAAPASTPPIETSSLILCILLIRYNPTAFQLQIGSLYTKSHKNRVFSNVRGYA